MSQRRTPVGLAIFLTAVTLLVTTWAVADSVSPTNTPRPTVLAPNDAQYISDSLPDAVAVGQPYQASIIMYNTGARTWTEGAVDGLAPTLNPLEGSIGLLEPGESIPQGQFKEFQTVLNPKLDDIPGVTQEWSMVSDAAGGYFGERLVKYIEVFLPTNTPTHTPTCAWTDEDYDLDNNGDVGASDLLILLKAIDGSGPMIDFGCDGHSDENDLFALMLHWKQNP